MLADVLNYVIPSEQLTNTRVQKSAVALAMIRVLTLTAMIATAMNVTIGE
jgi:hypothetical protein